MKQKNFSKISKIKFPYENVTIRKKRKLAANNSKNKLKELCGIYTKIRADQTRKIKAAGKIFHKILKQVLSTLQKTINVTFDEKKIKLAGILKKNGCR